MSDNQHLQQTVDIEGGQWKEDDHHELDECDDADALEELTDSQLCAYMLCTTYSRIAQNARHLFSWTDVTAFSMCQSLTGEGFLYDIAREMREKTGDNVDYLESLIDGYRRAERWAELAVNDYAKDTLKNWKDTDSFLDYEYYRAISRYVMDWLEDAETELRHDIKQGPIMDALICHEMDRRFNTLRIQAGLGVFW